MRTDDLLPNVLADRHTDLHAHELNRLGHRARRKDALFIKGAVIGQLVLQSSRKHAPAVRKDHRIVGRSGFTDDRSDEDRRSRLNRRRDQLVRALVDSANELGFEDQIFGWIADKLKLRAQQQVAVSRPSPHFQHRSGIALQVADALVHLGEGDPQPVGHERDLAAIVRPATFTELRLPR